MPVLWRELPPEQLEVLGACVAVVGAMDLEGFQAFLEETIPLRESLYCLDQIRDSIYMPCRSMLDVRY